jgi:hypothetical protein
MADADRFKAFYENDFAPGYSSMGMPSPPERVANAAEYSAYQLGQINQSLKRIAGTLEAQFGKGK